MKLYLLLIATIAITIIASIISGLRREKRERQHYQSINQHRPTWGYTDKH